MKKILLVIVLTAFSLYAPAQENKKDIVSQAFDNIDFKETLYSENVTHYLKLPLEYAKIYGSFSYDSLPIDRQVAEDVRLWVAAKYKCSYCMVFHASDLRASGVDQHKVDNITAYNESELFSPKEKAALNYAAAISDVDYQKMPAALTEAKRYFNNEEIETIISCTLLMDIWVRVFALKGKTPYYKQ